MACYVTLSPQPKCRHKAEVQNQNYPLTGGTKGRTEGNPIEVKQLHMWRLDIWDSLQAKTTTSNHLSAGLCQSWKSETNTCEKQSKNMRNIQFKARHQSAGEMIPCWSLNTLLMAMYCRCACHQQRTSTLPSGEKKQENPRTYRSLTWQLNQVDISFVVFPHIIHSRGPDIWLLPLVSPTHQKHTQCSTAWSGC